MCGEKKGGIEPQQSKLLLLNRLSAGPFHHFTLPFAVYNSLETPETPARNQAQHDFREDNSFPTEQFTILQFRTQFIR